ncbi:MAG: YiiX/YebB-like N1pC/P60 family cysteine hydrolase [Planctomycetaceae bacterium]
MGREARTIIALPGRTRGVARMARAAVLLSACFSALAGCRSSCLSAIAPGPFSRFDDAGLAQADLERAWDEWAVRNLETGDIVFRMGVSRVMLGLFDVSKFSSELADSDYSHAGLVVFEEGRPWVYDACRGHDVRRMPFSEFLMEYELAFGVKRLKPEYRVHIPGAVAYCRHVHELRVPFDEDFRLENGRLYCMELIEGAYRSSGLALSAPVRIDQFPNYHEHPTMIRLLTMYSSLTPDQRVLIPGNESIGMWASEKLELVYTAADPLSRPPIE